MDKTIQDKAADAVPFSTKCEFSYSESFRLYMILPSRSSPRSFPKVQGELPRKAWGRKM